MRERAGARVEGTPERDLAAGLEAILPGFAVLDRDLVLDGGLRAALVAADAQRHLVLVLDALALSEDQACLAALDALAWARAQRELVARHVGGGILDPSGEPRVVLVARAFSPLLLGRLAPLVPRSLLVVERRELESARARSAFYVPWVPPALAEPDPPAGFLERLDEGLQRRADLLLRRLRRVDEALSCSGSQAGLRWSLRGTELCEVLEDPRGLVGRVSGRAEAVLLARDEALEVFLDLALARYLELARDLEPQAVAGVLGAPPPAA